jgi:hypothetical protein
MFKKPFVCNNVANKHREPKAWKASPPVIYDSKCSLKITK